MELVGNPANRLSRDTACIEENTSGCLFIDYDYIHIN